MKGRVIFSFKSIFHCLLHFFNFFSLSIDFIPEEDQPLVKSSAQSPQAYSEDDREIEDIIRKTNSEDAIVYTVKKREDTRGTLALVYTICTFLFFFAGLIVAVIDGLTRHVSIIDNLKEILPVISGIFLSTLGFVLGYYFRKSEEK